MNSKSPLVLALEVAVRTMELALYHKRQETRLRYELGTIADFAVGNGDVCEVIARRARAAIAPKELAP